MLSRFAAIAAVLVLFGVFAAPVGGVPADDIPLIKATEDNIIIDLSRRAFVGKVAVYELAPNESDDAWKSKKPIFTHIVRDDADKLITFARFDVSPSGRRDRIYSKFVVAPAGLSQAEPLVPARFVEDMSGIARHRFSFPKTRSKKGLQVQMVDDAIKLGVQHAALNVVLSHLIDWKGRDKTISYVMDGQTFYFNPSEVSRLDSRIKALSEKGTVISLILLVRYRGGDSPSDRIMLHPRYNPACPNRFGAFNTVTSEGIKYFKAAMEFLIDRYTRPDRKFGLALNYIVGNEVSSHWWWSNMGEVSMEEFLEDYIRAVRIACTAACKICSAARVYICLDHHWNIHYGNNARRAFAGRPFIDRFARRARQQGDFGWNLAYHAYPENLWEPATWRDKLAVNSFETPKITFKNIEVLPAYFRRPELLYRGRQRHIILSEQGFHAKDGQEGELLQAAAFCYAYYKVAHLDGIDSFILYSHVDHLGEAGLRFGLWALDKTEAGLSRRKRKLYEVFRLADSPSWQEAFAFAKPIIGIDDWSQLLPQRHVREDGCSVERGCSSCSIGAKGCGE